MKRTIAAALIILTFALLLTGCGQKKEVTAPEPSDAASGETEAKSTPAQEPEWEPGSPEAVVQSFYNEYLAANKNGTAAKDGAYRNSPYLEAELVAKVDNVLASWEQSGSFKYDPFLCSREAPTQVVLNSAQVNGANASIIAQIGPWENRPWTKAVVTLRQKENQWKVDSVACLAP